MLYKYFNNRKGFSMIEVLIVVIILGVLVAIAVPVFDAVLKKQRKDDCRNQRLVIETTVKQAMYGMIDNGKKQPRITFVCPNDNGILVSCYDGETPEGEKYFILTGDSSCFTLGELRGGYRPDNIVDYKEGCDLGYYLKKRDYGINAFYLYLDSQEVPVCPFTSETDSYFYYILEDGSVHCSCELCAEE